MLKKTPTKSKTRPKKRVRYRDASFLKALSKRLRRIRISKGYSIDRLSLECENLSRATISRIEAAQTDPQVSTMYRIAECLGVSLPYLLDLSRER